MTSWFCRVLVALACLASSACSGDGADVDRGELDSGANSSEVAATEEPASTGAGAPAPSEPSYAFLRQGGLSYDELPNIWASLPYDAISLERQGCYGTCPVYRVKFSRGSGISDGHAEFEGQAWTEREGSFVGGISIWDYGRLCELLDRFGFLGFDENYAAGWTDDETVVVEVSDASGLHRVLDYGHQGPPELVALQLAIDAITDRIEWGTLDTMVAAASENAPNAPAD